MDLHLHTLYYERIPSPSLRVTHHILTLSPHTMYQAVGTKKGRDRFMLVNTFAGVHITLRSKLPKGRIR